jgi:thiaminase (transcriptional activator TenA)
VLYHPFVRRLGLGTLESRAFRAYIAQDAFFLQAFAQAYEQALKRCQDKGQGRPEHVQAIRWAIF